MSLGWRQEGHLVAKKTTKTNHEQTEYISLCKLGGMETPGQERRWAG